MSKETARINICGAWVDTRKFINIFADAMELNLDILDRFPERGESIADSCVKNYDAIIAEMRRQRRKLVRARYELRKEQENAKNQITGSKNQALPGRQDAGKENGRGSSV